MRCDYQALIEYSRDMAIADMPTKDLQWIAESVGVEAAVKLALEHSGVRLHLPRRLVFMLKKRCVQKLFNGANTRELANQLGVGETTIRKWTSPVASPAPQTTPAQTSLFEQSEPMQECG